MEPLSADDDDADIDAWRHQWRNGGASETQQDAGIADRHLWRCMQVICVYFTRYAFVICITHVTTSDTITTTNSFTGNVLWVEIIADKVQIVWKVQIQMS